MEAMDYSGLSGVHGVNAIKNVVLEFENEHVNVTDRSVSVLGNGIRLVGAIKLNAKANSIL